MSVNPTPNPLARVSYGGPTYFDSAAFYCPNIPLMSYGSTLDTILDLGSNVFVLVGWVGYQENALTAISWAFDNAPKGQWTLELKDSVAIIVFDRAEDAALFKLFML